MKVGMMVTLRLEMEDKELSDMPAYVSALVQEIQKSGVSVIAVSMDGGMMVGPSMVSKEMGSMVERGMGFQLPGGK